MGKSKDLATGNSAAYVETAGDTMTGGLNVNGGNLTHNSTSEAAHRYVILNTGATTDGHILFQRAASNKHQLTTKPDNSFNIYGYDASGDVFNIESSIREYMIQNLYEPSRITPASSFRFFILFAIYLNICFSLGGQDVKKQSGSISLNNIK